MTRVATLAVLLVTLSAASWAHEEPAASGEKLSTTTHAVRVEGREVRYTATAGTVPLKDGAGRTKAAMFFVA